MCELHLDEERVDNDGDVAMYHREGEKVVVFQIFIILEEYQLPLQNPVRTDFDGFKNYCFILNHLHKQQPPIQLLIATQFDKASQLINMSEHQGSEANPIVTDDNNAPAPRKYTLPLFLRRRVARLGKWREELSIGHRLIP